jgi:hypothetical protein
MQSAECRVQNAECRKGHDSFLHSAFCILHSSPGCTGQIDSGTLAFMEGWSSGPGVSLTHSRAFVTIDHEPATGKDGVGRDVTVVRQQDKAANVLTSIRIYAGESLQTVLLFWCRESTSDRVGIFLNEESEALFLGVGTLAAAVRLRAREVVGQHDVDLFWSFRRSGEYVLELGELACFLRAASGELLAEAPVDPPYEIHESSEGVRFESPVYGTQWLHYPCP